MAANTQSFTVLTDLPTFAGMPKGREDFIPSIDIRTFLRSLETYFVTHNVVTDQQKLHVLYSKIDKEKGDALKFVTSYAGDEVIPFQEIKNELLKYYPSFRTTELRHAAESLLETDLTGKDVGCALIALENSAKAVAEAYLSHDPLTKGDFSRQTTISAALPTTQTTQAAPRAAPASAATSASASASTSESSSPAGGSPATTGPAFPAVINVPPAIPLARVLQNLIMHVFMSTQIPQ